MKTYKATKKFQGLGIENSYQQLKTEDYFALKEGKNISLTQAPEHLLENDYIEEIKTKGKAE